MTDYRAGRRAVERKSRVRDLRKQQTEAERILWQRIRNGQLAGHKFRRQHEFSGYILDFYCPSARVAIELDGGQHLSSSGQADDAERTRVLEVNGILVLRYTNTVILKEIDAVLEAIVVELGKRQGF
jgi:very-short-patch-repair endonuclease